MLSEAPKCLCKLSLKLKIGYTNKLAGIHKSFRKCFVLRIFECIIFIVHQILISKEAGGESVYTFCDKYTYTDLTLSHAFAHSHTHGCSLWHTHAYTHARTNAVESELRKGN